ncbi:MAG: hypothetical protein H3C29_14625 [Simplicispira suum]|uniref:hypothetical protein n=1 Tax=Simplicispira suum TaxID=2109915 RepID=UPI001C6CA8B6|nr:hypothetical protein [Simplicispira suum]MBW7834437.1 hypothetical protein [Simplicispira suum]
MLTYIWIIIFILFIVIVWTRGGLGKGRKYGNKIAKHLGMSNNFFHTVLENGVTGPSLQVLAMLDGAGLTLQQACVQLAPSLNRGLIALENRFGRQEMIDNAKPIVSRLLKEWEDFQAQGGQQ